MQPSPKLQVQPEALVFLVNEDTKKATQVLRLANPDTRLHIFFKVRTTGKLRYVVKPNVGVVPPQSTFEVAIVFTLPVGEDISKPIKDKFVVFSMVGYKSALDRQQIDQHLTENISLCEKTNLVAVARLGSTSNGIKQSVTLPGSLAPSPPVMTPLSASLTKPDGLSRYPADDRRSARDTELLESGISRSYNASEVSANSKFTKMMETMKLKAGESTVHSSSRPLAQTLPVKMGEKSRSQRQNPVSLEAQVSNEVFFERTSKMIPEDSESSQYVVRPDKSFGAQDSIRSPVRTFDFPPAVASPRAPAAPSPLRPHTHAPPEQFVVWQLLLALILGTILGAFLNGK